MFDQPLVGRSQEIGKLEVVVLEGDLLEVLDEVDQRVVIQCVLADLAIEVDVAQHILQRIGVGFFQGCLLYTSRCV